MALVHVTACSGQVDEAFALLEPMLESLELIDPLDELSFVLSGTAQWLVLIEQGAPARTMFDRIISSCPPGGACRCWPVQRSIRPACHVCKDGWITLW